MSDDSGAGRLDGAEYDAELASLAVRAGRMGLFDWHLDTNAVLGDDTLKELFGLPTNVRLDADGFFDVIHPEDRERVQVEIRDSLEERADYDTTFRVVVDGAVRWLGGRGRVIERAPDGTPLRMMGVNWDRTEDEEKEAALERLAKEMNHRVNNAFAVIEALLALGARSATSVPQFSETLRAQVHALADAHRLMVGETLHEHGPSIEVPMRDLVQTSLREWVQREEGRIALAIDPLYVVPPNRIAGMAMLLHELATNSRRYGVLGPVQGALEVRVETEDEFSRLVWREYFEGEAPEPPANAKGSFGKALLHHCRDVLNAVIERNGRDGRGFIFSLRLPIVREDDDLPRTHPKGSPLRNNASAALRL